MPSELDQPPVHRGDPVPTFGSDSELIELKDDLKTIAVVLGGAVLGGCMDVAKDAAGNVAQRVENMKPRAARVYDWTIKEIEMARNIFKPRKLPNKK